MRKLFQFAAVPVTLEHCLRCIACGEISVSPSADFRCSACGDLLKIDFTAPRAGGVEDIARLKALWRERRASNHSLDSSGVWRFREMLPGLEDWSKAITLREGNTPLYELPRCAYSAGVERLLAKHQGMNPTGSFKD